MNIEINDNEIYKRLINFLENDNIDYATVSFEDGISVQIPVSDYIDEIKHIINSNNLVELVI